MRTWIDNSTVGVFGSFRFSRALLTAGCIALQIMKAVPPPIGLSLKFAVLLLSVPIILLQWGYRWPDIYDSYSQPFFGFRIGNTEVSFAVLFAPGLSRAVEHLTAHVADAGLHTRG
jgi:hypothetical protein